MAKTCHRYFSFVDNVAILGTILWLQLVAQQASSKDLEPLFAFTELCSKDSSELEQIKDAVTEQKRPMTRSEMRSAVLAALDAFSKGVGPKFREWDPGGGKHGVEPKYTCGQIPVGQRLRGLDFTVLDENELNGLDLRGACIRKSRLLGLNLSQVKLQGANLYGSCLALTNLNAVDLTGAVLERTNLVRAEFQNANLNGATLSRADMREAYFAGKGISLADTVFEPRSVPSLEGLDQVADQLALMTYKNTAEGLAALRASLRDGGLRQAERAITYAIERTRTDEAAQPEKAARIVLFQWPTEYGMFPLHAIWGLFYFWLGFTCIYTAVLIVGSDRVGNIYRFYPPPKESVACFGDDKQLPPKKIAPRGIYAATAWAAYFSLISALHIGWRDLNMGEWLNRMNPSEFALRPTRYVRMLSTIQSVISVYLVAMAAITYFGRPFG